ncbi:hypothetical protein [Caulobacter sp. X]|uniref:hypothetical protein n=1 Tax=Caulobacter sp. X TaxID=2048901 RepID=UPI001374735A|nr:hypothetical protein [Caulobacter sp. X]
MNRQDQKVIIHELGDRIGKAAPGVMHEIGRFDANTVELILSADGMRSNIPGVLALSRAAPRLEGFLFTAFRRRWSKPGLGIYDAHIGMEDLRYVAEDGGDGRLDLTLYLRGDWDERERNMIGFLMLDQALGEYDVMTGLGRVDIEPAGAVVQGKPFAGLMAEFDAFRAETVH